MNFSLIKFPSFTFLLYFSWWQIANHCWYNIRTTLWTLLKIYIILYFPDIFCIYENMIAISHWWHGYYAEEKSSPSICLGSSQADRGIKIVSDRLEEERNQFNDMCTRELHPLCSYILNWNNPVSVVESSISNLMYRRGWQSKYQGASHSKVGDDFMLAQNKDVFLIQDISIEKVVK